LDVFFIVGLTLILIALGLFIVSFIVFVLLPFIIAELVIFGGLFILFELAIKLVFSS